MKKQLIYLFISFLFVSVLKTNAQFNNDAPWMQELQKKSLKEKYTLTEISDAFNQYWENNKELKDKKGSGYKPFKRWENRWQLALDKDQYIISQNQIWKQWKEKNLLAQKSPNEISDWQNIGPFTQESKSGQGRVNTIIVDPNNPNTYYIGAPAGGIWKSTDQGDTWTPLSDNLPQIGVSGIAIDFTNSNTIYISTGDDDAGDTYSVGVLKSTDGGLTWNTTGLQFNNSGERSNEIYMHPTNNQILWVATSDGLYKTINGGNTWVRKRTGNIRDLKVHPTNPDIIYVVSSSNFYKSTNAGESFTTITNGLPNSSNRLAIEVTAANPNLVYLLSADDSNNFQGLYKSTNSGNSFTRTNEFDDIFQSSQSWYDMSLTVSDVDENIIFVGVLDIWKSTNGGDNFTRLNNWFDSSSPRFTHADIHFLRYFNGELFCGSDGGIYKSTNDGNVFNELNEGLAISQYYRISVSKQSADNVVGGLQDNGGFAYSNQTWYKYHGGDGMDCAVDPNNPNTYYGFTQYGGSLSVTQNGGVSGQGVAGSPEGGSWITPLTINSQGELYAGYSHLYKLVNGSWSQVSGNVFGGRVQRVEIDPNNEDIIYVGRGNTLFKSTNRGIDFTQIYSANDNISSVEVNNDNSNLVYLSTSGGNNGQILKSINGGVSFANITGNLPSDSKLIIKHQIHSPLNDLYIGSSIGVYHINDGMANWETYSTNLPNVPIRDLEININDRILTAGTYGRSVWQTPIEVAAPNDDIRLVVINNPNSSVNCGTDISPEILVRNEGLNTISAVTVNYVVDGTSLTFNYTGTIASQATQIITLPNITGLSLGIHQISVETTIANDAYSDNNDSNVTFFTNQVDANPTTVNPFETTQDSWLVTGSSNTWEIGEPSTSLLSGSGSGYVTRVNGQYFNNTSSYLTTPCYNLSQIQNPILKFYMKFDLEINYDVMYVEYSINGNDLWQVLGTANDPNWYNSNFSSNALTIGSQWTGSDSVLKEYSYNLSNFLSETEISFRFSFLSDQSLTKEGVFIDNFVIQGTPLSVENDLLTNFIIYPNPSNGIFILERNSNELMQINVFDITGKLIYKKEDISDSSYNMNLSTIEKGIYFATIKIGNKKTTKKLILN